MQTNNNLKLFAGSSNKELANSIASFLNLKISAAKIQNFSDGETFVQIEESVSNCCCFIVQSTSTPVNSNLMELLIFADCLKRSRARKIVAIIPYFGYSRQDKISQFGEPITAKLVANLLETSGIDEILTLDLHSKQIQGFFNKPIFNISSEDFAINQIKTVLSNNSSKQAAILSPDFGSVARNRLIAEKLNLPLIVLEKHRPKANSSEILNIIGNPEGKNILIFDDIVDTAGTICNAANFIKNQGKAKSVFVFATHGIFSGQAAEKINSSSIDSFFVSNSINIQAESLKIKICNIAEFLALKIKEAYADEFEQSIFNEKAGLN